MGDYASSCPFFIYTTMFGANYFGGIYFAGSQQILSVGTPIWILPANHDSSENQTTELTFYLPSSADSAHFEIQLDKVSTFNGVNLQSIKSWLSQTGWYYYDGAVWVAFPSTGVPTSFAGNQAKYVIQTPLSLGTWYRRIRGRVPL